jgi:hypothetical protein
MEKKSNKTHNYTHLNYCPHAMKMTGSLKRFTNITKAVYNNNNNYMLHFITCSMPASVSSWHTKEWQVIQHRQNNLRVMQENLVCSTFTDNLNQRVCWFTWEKGDVNYSRLFMALSSAMKSLYVLFLNHKSANIYSCTYPLALTLNLSCLMSCTPVTQWDAKNAIQMVDKHKG